MDIQFGEGTIEQHPYDLPYHWCASGFYRYLWAEKVNRVRRLVNQRRLIDVGCGDGYLTSRLAQLAADVYAFDVNERAIAFARIIVDRPNVHFHIGRAGDLRDHAAAYGGGVEVITAFEIVEHLSAGERESFLARAREILSETDGKLVISTPNGGRRRALGRHHFEEFDALQLRGILEASGFKTLRSEGIYIAPPARLRLEHFADTTPFRAAFRQLVRLGSRRPSWSHTLLAVAQPA